MSNSRLTLTPSEAVKLLNKICYDEYQKGKRKININRVWEIVDAALPKNAPMDTHSVPEYNGGYVFNDTDTSTNTDNHYMPSGVIG